MVTEVHYADVGSAEIAYRTTGEGRPLLLIHGWPLSGATWRHVIPQLPTFRCIATDSPGAGDTRYKPDHSFRFRGQAEAYARLIDVLGLEQLDVLAHDTARRSRASSH
jgi:pimeloyl-ACP methyl ester carboxylesterase